MTKIVGLIVSDDVRDWAEDQEIELPDDDGLDVFLKLHERTIVEAMEYAGLEAIKRLHERLTANGGSLGLVHEDVP